MARVAPLLAFCLVLVGPACASAQTSGPRSFRSLTSNVSQASATGVREITVQWTTTPAPAGVQAVGTFTVLRQRATTGGLRRERQPELSPNHLVVVLQNSAGRELDWRLVTNPRIQRAEAPGPDGRLSGQVFEQSSAELLLTVPDITGADRIQIYRPVWNGKDYDLEPLAQVVVGNSR